MIVSSVWGHPTREDAKRLPTIPIVSITETDGRAARSSLPSRARVQVQLEAKTDTGWKRIPLVIVEIPGMAYRAREVRPDRQSHRFLA